MPLQRRIPKRGFNNIFAKKIVSINVGALECFENGAVVDTQALIDAGLVLSLIHIWCGCIAAKCCMTTASPARKEANNNVAA